MSKRRQWNYQYVSSNSLEELVVAVNKKLSEGFIAVGTPIHHNFYFGKGRLHQAIVMDSGVVAGGKTVLKETIIKHDSPSGLVEDEENKWRPTWDTGGKGHEEPK